MPIRNVVSSLPDERYIAALEAELEDLRAMVQRLQEAFTNQSRGR